MSVESVQKSPGGDQWDNSDEIDLSLYVNALASRWLEIVLTALAVVALTGGGVLAYRALTPPVYEATATAAIIRTSTDVVFDERFTTSSVEPNLDVNSRRLALIALVGSSSIAQQVIDELGEQLPANLRAPEELIQVVEGDTATVEGRSGQSDLINITVRSQSPEVSAAVANAWARAYVRLVNSIYGQVPDDMLQSVEAQLAEAQQEYAAAQVRLEEHLAASLLTELNRQTSALIRNLDVQNSSGDAQLRAYYDQRLRTRNLLLAARALDEQLAAGGPAAGVTTGQALQLLKLQMVNAAALLPPALNKQDEPVQPEQQPGALLQLQVTGPAAVDAEALGAEIAATIASLEAQMGRIEGEIEEGARVLMSGEAPVLPAVAQLEEQLRLLQSQVEVESGRRLEFTQQRDLAWESVKALSNKQAELRLARAAANSEVRLSSTAVPLNRPVEEVGLVSSVAVSALAGVILGMVVALLLHFMQVRPLRSPRPA